MSQRARVVAALVAAAVHVAVLAPLADGFSVIVGPVFQPQAEAILNGALPYEERGFEYPPLALPLLLAPAAVSDGVAGYVEAFSWEMIGFDLAIVALLALGLRDAATRVVAALACYSVGVFVLSGTLAPDSTLDASLPLARFDLAPAALVLAAVLAREAARSATWSALVSIAAAVKAYPLLLYPVLVRGERSPRRVAIAAILPLAVAAVVVLATGDRFGSAITFQSERDLQIETVAATPLLVAHLLGGGAGITVGGGSYNIDASGADAARAISLILLVVGYALVVWLAWRSKAPPMHAAAAVIAVAIVFAPVLSPQFLLWLLPISAAAYGLRGPNLVLLAAIVLTQVVLSEYGQLAELDAGFIVPLAIRNALLLAYLATALYPMAAATGRSGCPTAPAWPTRSRSRRPA
jgi:Glycosyltransferase family 87